MSEHQPTPFTIIVPKSKVDDTDIAMLSSPAWVMAASAICLRAGCYLSSEAKRGVSFGYCNADGVLCSKAEATHFGMAPTAAEAT